MKNLKENSVNPLYTDWVKQQMKSGKLDSSTIHDMFGQLNRGEAHLVNGQFVKGAVKNPVVNNVAATAQKTAKTAPTKFGKYGKVAAGVGAVGLGAYGIYRWAKNKKAAAQKENQ